jgi:nicotinate dehydrogenase subunit A
MAKITLLVNEKDHILDISPDTPLLYALRNNLKLNAPKYGCGIERCGSCMVLMDREAMPSCMRPCSSLTQTKITTLEGLGNAANLAPIQIAFIEEQAAQCGYCLNGMIISAKALLDKNANPSDAEIRVALQRVLCRCGTYSRIIKAVKRAAKKMNELVING